MACPTCDSDDGAVGTASLLLVEGVDLFTVKEILGHSQISLTANTYGHLTEKLSDDAMSRLGRALDAETGRWSIPRSIPQTRLSRLA